MIMIPYRVVVEVVVHLDLAMAMVKAICTLACTASAIPGHDRPWQLMRHVYCVHVPFECLFEISNSSFRKLSLELCPWIVEFYVLAARDTYAKHPSTSTRQTIAPDRREHARRKPYYCYDCYGAPGGSCDPCVHVPFAINSLIAFCNN